MPDISTIMLISGYVNRHRPFFRQPVPRLPVVVWTARARVSPERIASPDRLGKRIPATGAEPAGQGGPGAFGADWQFAPLPGQRTKPCLRRVGRPDAQDAGS